MKKNEEKKQEAPEGNPRELPQDAPKRQIIIETDGSNISIIKNETAGVLELQAVLSTILNKLINTK